MTTNYSLEKGIPQSRMGPSALYMPNKSAATFDDSHQSKLKLSDFELLKRIGKGGFGEVHVCRKKDTKEVLALKIVDKNLIWKKNKIRQLKNERNVLASNWNHFMVQLMYSFQDKHHCYLAMEYCPGGDLRHLLKALGSLEEDEARLYIAEMILSVYALHQLGYIHRDLKPDNFLIDAKGHLKLTDFGLSKDGIKSQIFQQTPSKPKEPRPSTVTPSNSSTVTPSNSSTSISFNNSHIGHFNQGSLPTPISDLTVKALHLKNHTIASDSPEPPVIHHDTSSLAFSVVGSPNYMSPEVLNGMQGYGTEVDWWSLGCIFFELVCGNPPFIGDTPQDVFDSILNWKETLPKTLEEYEDFVSPVFLDLISKFLCEPSSRISDRFGLDSILNHPFFELLELERLFDLEPPFVPSLADDADTTYFEADTSTHTADLIPPLTQDSNELSQHGPIGSFHRSGIASNSSISSFYHDQSNLFRGGISSERDSSVAIKCPRTAPRHLAHRRSATAEAPSIDKLLAVYHLHNTGSTQNFHQGKEDRINFDEDEWTDDSGSQKGKRNENNAMLSTTQSKTHSPPMASPYRVGSYGRMDITRSTMKCFTPLHTSTRNANALFSTNKISSPVRDIAGFTFQRKRHIRSIFNSEFTPMAKSPLETIDPSIFFGFGNLSIALDDEENATSPNHVVPSGSTSKFTHEIDNPMKESTSPMLSKSSAASATSPPIRVKSPFFSIPAEIQDDDDFLEAADISSFMQDTPRALQFEGV